VSAAPSVDAVTGAQARAAGDGYAAIRERVKYFAQRVMLMRCCVVTVRDDARYALQRSDTMLLLPPLRRFRYAAAADATLLLPAACRHAFHAAALRWRIAYFLLMLPLYYAAADAPLRYAMPPFTPFFAAATLRVTA